MKRRKKERRETRNEIKEEWKRRRMKEETNGEGEVGMEREGRPGKEDGR